MGGVNFDRHFFQMTSADLHLPNGRIFHFAHSSQPTHVRSLVLHEHAGAFAAVSVRLTPKFATALPILRLGCVGEFIMTAWKIRILSLAKNHCTQCAKRLGSPESRDEFLKANCSQSHFWNVVTEIYRYHYSVNPIVLT